MINLVVCFLFGVMFGMVALFTGAITYAEHKRKRAGKQIARVAKMVDRGECEELRIMYKRG